MEDTITRIRRIVDELEKLEIACSQTSAKLSQPSIVQSEDIVIDNTGGSEDVVQPLFASTTPSARAIVKRDAGDTGSVFLGDSTQQKYPVEPSEKIELMVSDLSVVYVKVSAGAKATLHVLWEA